MEEKLSLNKIIEKENLSESVVRMVLEAPVVAQKRKAGQFIVLKIHEKGERIPLTIVDSGWNLHQLFEIFADAPRAAAIRAGVGNHLARAAACRTGAG